MVVPFEPQHLRQIVLQSSQAWMQPMLEADYGEQVAVLGPAYSMVDGDEVIACAGLVPIWEGRSQAWALISTEAGRHMVRIVRAIREFLAGQDVRRIEATVDAGFYPGHRLMAMLGFDREGMMLHYLPDGRHCCLYSRTK